MKRIANYLMIGILGVMLLMSGCGKEGGEPQLKDEGKPIFETSKDVNPTETPEVTEEPEEGREENAEGQVKSYLTGEFIAKEQGERRPVAVMLNNIIDACPQSGISRAGVVYEAPVEGKITRLMGIFEDYDDLEKIGSVRSCREYYIFFAEEFNALYAHYGQAAYAVPFLEQDFVNNLSGLGQYGGDIYYRSTDRVAPHNAYTSYDGIQRGIKDYGYSQTYSEDYPGHYQFADIGESVDLEDAKGAVPASKISMNCYPVNKPWFEYDETTKKYKRFQYGNIQIDQMTNEQLEFDNILIQYVKYEPYDANGYLNLDVISGGEGKYITHGKAIDVRWEKNEPWGQTHYITKQEEEITLNTGKTFVEIVLDDTIKDITIE